MCALFADIKKFRIGLESLHFQTFFANADFELEQRDGHGKLRSCHTHGKFMEKIFEKSVGTLLVDI